MVEDGDFTDPNLPSTKATEINKQRQKTYGDPTPNMEVFADLLMGYGFRVDGRMPTAEDATMVCILLKIMREKQSRFKLDYPDNVDDICGWANVLYKAKESRRGSHEAAG